MSWNTWKDDFIESAGFAFRLEDLRERGIRSDSPSEFKKTCGINQVKELMFQRSIYETMSTMGWNKSFWKIEYPYEKKGVSKRADFAIRNPDGKAGQAWHYIEMKEYDTGKVKVDAAKLKQASGRGSHAHMIIYDWTHSIKKGVSGKTKLLEKIEGKFPETFHYSGKNAPKEHDFKTLVPKYLRNKKSDGVPGRVEIVLLTVK
ncbi:MAG: hypothetical protein ACPG60_04015 [Poseidonia sp.]